MIVVSLRVYDRFGARWCVRRIFDSFFNSRGCVEFSDRIKISCGGGGGVGVGCCGGECVV